MSKKQKILIVEDEALIAADLSTTLSEFNFEILGPYDKGEAALADLSKLNPDLILMDINLNGSIDGIKTAEEVQKIVNVPIVFLSALKDESTLQRVKLVNPYGYLLKPFDGAELKTIIELTLQRFTSNEGSKVDQEKYHDEHDIESNLNLTDTAAILAKLDIFNEIPSKAINILSQVCMIREIEAGQFLIFEGEKSKGAFIPLSGRISVTKTSETGKELIVALLAPSDPFGLFFTIPAFKTSCSAKTQTDARIIWIPIEEWNHFVSDNPVVFRNISNALATRLTASHSLSSSLAHARVEERIIHTLLALIPDFGKSTSGNSPDAGRIFITRKELAELTGTTPETAIRVTKNLERQGALDLTRAGIIKIPSFEKLKSLLGDS